MFYEDIMIAMIIYFIGLVLILIICTNRIIAAIKQLKDRD